VLFFMLSQRAKLDAVNAVGLASGDEARQKPRRKREQEEEKPR